MSATYTIEELKPVVGQNLLNLRRGAGLTQGELASKINYSDKSISKWECGDTLPDLSVLLQLASFYGVTLDYLTIPHSGVVLNTDKKKTKNRVMIIFLSAILVWLIAVCFYVLATPLFTNPTYTWMTYIYALPICSLVIFILCWIWKYNFSHYFFLSIFVWTLILALFLTATCFFPYEDAWMLFLVGIPLQFMVIFWSILKHKKKVVPLEDISQELKSFK